MNDSRRLDGNASGSRVLMYLHVLFLLFFLLRLFETFDDEILEELSVFYRNMVSGTWCKKVNL